jgi:hypothetical protein
MYLNSLQKKRLLNQNHSAKNAALTASEAIVVG